MSTSTSYLSIARCTVLYDDDYLYIHMGHALRGPELAAAGFYLLFLLPAVALLAVEPVRSLPIIILNIGWWAYFFGRDTLWHLFGEELFVIGRQAIVYQRLYGPLRTHTRVYSIGEQIGVDFIPDQEYGDAMLGHLALSIHTAAGSSTAAVHSAHVLSGPAFASIRHSVLRFFTPALFRELWLN